MWGYCRAGPAGCASSRRPCASGISPTEKVPGTGRWWSSPKHTGSGRVQSIQALVEVHAERLVGVERPRDFNQDMGKLGEDAPVACFVGVGQSAARHRAAKPQVIEFPGHGSEAGFDVPQALAVSQLREGHRQVLIPVRKLPRLRMIVVTGHAFLKLLVREMGDQL